MASTEELLQLFDRLCTRTVVVAPQEHADAIRHRVETFDALVDAIEKIKSLPRYSISQSFLIDPSPDKLLKANEVDPILHTALKQAEAGDD